MKNYVKEGQKLPLYGVGPMIVFGMGAVTAIGIILFAYVWKTGVLETSWVPLCRIAGALLIVRGAHHGDDDPEDDANQKRQRRDIECGEDAVQVLLPAVLVQKSLIKVDIELLP